MVIQSIITGTGHYLPKNIIKNECFIKNIFYESKGNIVNNTKDIIKKFKNITGIIERRYVDKNMKNSDIATISAELAIANAKINKENIDYIICAHNYGDINPISNQTDIMPSISSKIKNKLNIKNTKCKPYDMIFGCAGWIEGMILADQLLKSRNANNILVIGSDTLSYVIDPHDKNSMIFSDGSGAVIVSAISMNCKRNKFGIICYDSQCDNTDQFNYLYNGKSYNKNYNGSLINIKMNGRKIYEYAIKKVPIILKKILDKNKLILKDIKKILLHQANAKMDYAIVKNLINLYNGNKKPFYSYINKILPMTIHKFGNSSVATIPTLLDLILKKKILYHRIYPGDTILMGSLGAGMHINGMIYKFPF